MKLKTLGGVLGVLSSLIPLSCIFYSISISPWFSFHHNALSDLGVRAPSALIFNLGLILGGALGVLLSSILIYGFKGYLRGLIGSTFLLLTTLSLSLIGLFTEESGAIHLYVSIAFFVLLPIAQISFSIVLKRLVKEWPLSVVFGAISALVWVFPWKAAAIPELISSLSGSAWIIWISLLLITERLDEDRRLRSMF